MEFKGDKESDMAKEEYRFGWFSYTPQWMQRFNTAGWFLFWMFWWNNFGSMVNNGLFGVVLSSLETRFGLTSTQSSWIVTSYDVAGIPVVLFISFYGNRAHAPRWTAVGTFLVFIGTVICVLPHFTTGVYDPTLSETDNYLCGNRTGVNPYCEGQSESNLSLYLIVFITGRIIAGIGSPPSYTLGFTHMDDITSREKFGLFTGIYSCGGLLGPAIGYVVGGYLLELHTDFYQIDSDSLSFDISDPRWVGCWWLAFIIGGVFVLVITLPLAAFPKDLPGAAELRKQKISEVHGSDQTSGTPSDSSHGKKLSKADSLKNIKALLTNPTYICITIYGAIDGLIVAGFTAFGPKFMENEFNLDASTAGMIFGLVTVPGGGGGAIFGGWLINRFSLSCKAILRVMVILTVLICLSALGFLIWCDPIPVAGVNTPYNGSIDITRDSACISDCFCEEVPFSPVCSSEGIQYLSPCHAGCTNFTSLLDNSREYMNCSCIPLSTSHVTQASDGSCAGPDCPLVPLFLVVFFLAMFFLFAVGTMILPVMFRCVPDDARNMGVSVANVTGRIFGWLPGPIIFGAVFDSACLLWRQDCGDKGACLYYDNESIGLNVFILVLGFKLLSLVAIVAAYLLYKPPKMKSEDFRSDSEKSVITNGVVNKPDSDQQTSNKNSLYQGQMTETAEVFMTDNSGDTEKNVFSSDTGLSDNILSTAF